MPDMADKIEDIETSVLPKEDFAYVIEASKNGTCNLDGTAVSIDKFMAELAKNPEKGSEAWKRSLTLAGAATAGSTISILPMLAMGPLAPLALAGLHASYKLGDNRICRLIIGNETDGDLIKHDLYLDCGKQTARAVFEEKDAETGRMTASKTDTIPGRMDWGGGFETCGIGMYRFEKNLDMVIGFYGTAGAISFTSTDPAIDKVFAIAWSVPERGDAAVAVCENLRMFENLQEFYEKSIEKGAKSASATAKSKAGNAVAEIRAAVSFANFPDASDEKDRVVAVTISPVSAAA
jgi:hypothetical protein